MKLKLSRCLSGFMVVLLLFMLCVPAYASSGSIYNQQASFWDWVTHNPVSEWTGISDLLGYTFGAYCPTSDDGYHHANSYQVDKGGGSYKCICSYCGHSFIAYESDLKQSYNDYVGTLPATGWTSEGHLIWQSQFSNLYDGNIYYTSGNGSSPFIKFDGFSVNSTGDGFVASIANMTWQYKPYSCGVGITNFPISGLYCCLATRALNIKVYTSTAFYDRTAEYKLGNYLYCSPTSKVFITSGTSLNYDGNQIYLAFEGFCPVFEIIPESNLGFSFGDIYSITTRPTTITGGNYGIVGDIGQIIKVTNNSTIINETNNTYYNPATGNTETVNSWSYDYSDRSYNITLESGDTVTVTYGDENITIVEGDVIYNIYYIIDGSGSNSGSGSDDNCEHEWYQTGHRQGNCLTAEQRTYTCSKCNKQYTETDPAPGHSWRIIQEVSTKYDESGTLIQEGYTIYECERCGEQYKATNDTGPPPSGGGGSGGDSDNNGNDGQSIWDKLGEFFGTILGGIIGLIEAVIGKILDALIALGEMLMDKLSAIVEIVLSVLEEVPKLFGGFLDFLGLVFPYLPSEITLLLTFGVVAVVFIGIIKALRR